MLHRGAKFKNQDFRKESSGQDMGSGNRNKVFFLSFLCRIFFQLLVMTDRSQSALFATYHSKLGICPMIASKYLGCHSRQNGNPETKNRNHWIPASAGTTKPDKFLVIPGKPEIQIAKTGFRVKPGMTIKVNGL